MQTLSDYKDILKPGLCALCGHCALTYTDPEGDRLCLSCLELLLEPLAELPPTEDDKILCREVVAENRRRMNAQV